jgi:sterol desaturase/sphingolipid hydroxylase (fatty acid hydroxylase superfamily)
VNQQAVAPQRSNYRRPPAEGSRRSRLLVLAVLTAGANVVAIGVVTWAAHGTVSDRVFANVWDGWRTAIWQPWFGAFILGLWLLQWRFPARRQERPVNKGLVQDLAWFLLSPVLAVTVISAYLVVLSVGVTTVFGDATLHLVPSLGVWRVALLAFVLSDFVAWLSHWTHHRLPTLWQFHAVHHSQREMNVLSDNRQHVVETIVAATIGFLPAWFLGLDTAKAATLAVSTVYVSAFIHTNIRTNLGPLRFVFVSPQAHRVHHSIEPRHYDTNFGTVFSWWDYLFGTRYPGDHEYPPTGIVDEAFPLERSAHPVRVVATWGAQLLYPFRVLATQD